MRKLIIIDQDGTEERNEIFDMLYASRKEDIEAPNQKRTEFIQENELKDITHDDIIEYVKKIPNISNEIQEELRKKIEKLLENRDMINSFDCKLYYMAGANDIINIIFNGGT